MGGVPGDKTNSKLKHTANNIVRVLLGGSQMGLWTEVVLCLLDFSVIGTMKTRLDIFFVHGI